MTTSIPPHIAAALADPDPTNEIARKVAEAISVYSECFARAVQRNGGFGRPIVLPEPRDEYEAAALNLFMHEMRASLPPDTVLRFAPGADAGSRH